MKHFSKPIGTYKLQLGFNLLELMIATFLGLFVLGAILTLFVSMLRTDTDKVKSIQLNQELRSTMSLMTRDIRRAGANQNSAVNAATTPPTNPYSVAGTTQLAVAANQGGIANSCITYSYNSGEANQLYGFRLGNTNPNTVQSRAAGAACNANGWNNLTDPSLVNVSALTFSNSTTIESGLSIRQIGITLTANLVSDPTVVRTVSETVKIRNDHF